MYISIWYYVLALLSAALATGCRSFPEIEDGLRNLSSDGIVPIGIPAFGRVDDGLYRGGQPSEQGFSELKQMGIKTVISLKVFGSDRKYLVPLDMQYEHISFKNYHPEDEDVMKFLKIVTEPSNRPVFLHCHEGTDRTGMMVAVYRIVVEGWTKERALAEMKAFGFNEIWGSLENYIEELDVSKIKYELTSTEKHPLITDV